MARTRRHRSRKHSRKQKQRGGGWGFTGPAFAPAGGMAPEASRALTDDCVVLDRPAPSVTPTGAWSQSGGGCGSCSIMAPQPQVGGFSLLNPSSWFGGVSGEQSPSSDTAEVDMTSASTIVSPVDETVPVPSGMTGGRRHRKHRKQRGGGGGTGGYGFVLDNTMGGKVYSGLTVGSCPSAPQRGGGPSLGDASIVSYPAGYGYAPASAIEEGGGSAHFLAQIPYGKQCMGGGARKATRGIGGARKRKSRRHRKSHKKSRKGRKHH